MCQMDGVCGTASQVERSGHKVTVTCHVRYEIAHRLLARWTSMVYIHSWQEFQDAAEALYSKSPNDVCSINLYKTDFLLSDQSSILQTRYCVKWRSSQGKLVLKITDNTTVSSVKNLILPYQSHFSNLQQPSVSSSKLILPFFSIDSRHWTCHWCKRCKTKDDKRIHHLILLRLPKYFHQLKTTVLALCPPKLQVWFHLQHQQLGVSKRKSQRRKNSHNWLFFFYPRDINDWKRAVLQNNGDLREQVRRVCLYRLFSTSYRKSTSGVCALC